MLETIDDSWSMDFTHDRLSDGRSYGQLNVIDDYSHEGFGIEIDLSLPAEPVIRTLDHNIHLVLYNPASHSKIPTSNATTTPFAMCTSPTSIDTHR